MLHRTQDKYLEVTIKTPKIVLKNNVKVNLTSNVKNFTETTSEMFSNGHVKQTNMPSAKGKNYRQKGKLEVTR